MYVNYTTKCLLELSITLCIRHTYIVRLYERNHLTKTFSPLPLPPKS